MDALDLFCGAAGGWALGLHRAGWRTLAACESDPWRRAVYSYRWPQTAMFDDVRTLTGGALAAAGIGPVDIVVGSPPCQDASSANAQGRGIDGARTGLFSEAVRLVGELRPRWFAFENVAGLRVRGVDRVCVGLEAAGYTPWPLVVGAVHAGAPHLRSRVWIVGRRNDADAAPVQRAALAGREPDGAGAGAVPDADRDGIRQQWECAGRDRVATAEPARDAAADSRHGQQVADLRAGRASAESGTPHDGEPDGYRGRAAADADGREPQEPGRLTNGCIGLGSRTSEVLGAWDHWNGGAPALGRVDDGLPAKLAARRGLGRACLAAYGDSVVPEITYHLARAIEAVDSEGR